MPSPAEIIIVGATFALVSMPDAAVQPGMPLVPLYDIKEGEILRTEGTGGPAGSAGHLPGRLGDGRRAGAAHRKLSN